MGEKAGENWKQQLKELVEKHKDVEGKNSPLR